MGNIKWVSPKLGRSEILNKEKSIAQYVNYMLARTQSMFKWQNLPDSIPERMLEFYLQTHSNCIFAEHNGELYAFTGGWGGEPDAYYRPTKYVVANPALNFSKEFTIDKDCVLCLSDSMNMGLIPMFERWAIQLTENDISIRLADINMRLMFLLSATDDKSKKAAVEFMKEIERGNLGVVAENAFLGGVNMQSPQGVSSNYISQLIELEQYLKSGWYTDLGLQSNYNMKRESLNSAETTMDSDILLPFVDDMLKCRQLAVEKVNAMFGTDIAVDFNSSWKNRQNTTEMDETNENLMNPDNQKEGEVDEAENIE